MTYDRTELVKSLDSVWDVLLMARDDCIPEGKDESYDEQWDEVCEAMSKIHKALNIKQEEV